MERGWIVTLFHSIQTISEISEELGRISMGQYQRTHIKLPLDTTGETYNQSEKNKALYKASIFWEKWLTFIQQDFY